MVSSVAVDPALDDQVDKGPGGHDGRLDVRQHEAAVLEIDDRFAEGLAILGVFHGQAQGAFHHRDGADADLRALVGQLAHQRVEATTFHFAEQAVGRHFDVIEEHFRGVLGVHADFAQQLAATETRGVGVDHEQRNALGALA